MLTKIPENDIIPVRLELFLRLMHRYTTEFAATTETTRYVARWLEVSDHAEDTNTTLVHHWFISDDMRMLAMLSKYRTATIKSALQHLQLDKDLRR